MSPLRTGSAWTSSIRCTGGPSYYSLIGWCASAAVGSEPPEDFSPRCCSSPSSYLFYFSSSNATRNCHLFAFICTRPRRHGYIDNLTSVADTCRPAAAVLSANQLLFYNIQSSSAARRQRWNVRISSATTSDQASWRRVAHFNYCEEVTTQLKELVSEQSPQNKLDLTWSSGEMKWRKKSIE